MSDFSTLSLVQLKEECKSQGLPVTGTKAVLLQRLTDNGGAPSTKKTEAKMEVEEEVIKKTVKRKAEEEPAAEPSEAKKQKSSAKIKVDEICNLGAGTEVVDNWGATLNQTNISSNNNKFYVIQVLKKGASYYCYTRWGRVEERGQNACKLSPSLAAAQSEFKKKFREKTKNNWDDVSGDFNKFLKYDGLYCLLEMNYEDDDPALLKEALDSIKEKKMKLASKKVRPSKLPKPTQDLISLIFDLDMFKEQMSKFELNVKELPLGKLSSAQIDKGFAVLEKISAAITNKAPRGTFDKLCSEFYTVIPHAFGRRVPPIFSDPESVQQKKDMLSVLSDIALAQELTKKGEKLDAEKGDEDDWIENQIDKNYDLLKADIEPLDQNTEEFKVINTYLQNTMNQGQFAKKLVLLDVFAVKRESEPARFSAHSDIVERKLLWHGTNVAVLVAILSTGLRIMPHSGGRVGKGIYFASENSKSAGYVGTTATNVGFMFLNEVALGKQHIITKDDHTLRQAPTGFDSIVAKGWTEPDPKHDAILKLDGNDVVVPQGKAIKTEYAHSSFSQSEYLIYKESQNQIRYLLKLQF